MIADLLKKEIKSVVSELGFGDIAIELSHPNDLSHGDYAANTAMILAKKEGKNPVEIAGDVVNGLKEKDIDFISKIEIAGPGFINFTLAPGFFVNETKNILNSSESYGQSEVYKGKKILVEHSSPNLFKPFHVGHVMNNAIGESSARLADFAGGEVVTISYPSDVSLGIAKAIWGIKNIMVKYQDESFEKIKNSSDLNRKLRLMSNAYVWGNAAYEYIDGEMAGYLKSGPTKEELRIEIRSINSCLYQGGCDKVTEEIYNWGKETSLDYFKNMTKRLGSDFADFIYESEAGEVGLQIIKDNTPGIFTESEGAVIYEGDKDGLHTRVFVNKEGYPTYEAKDIGLLSLKFDRFSPDISALVTDHEQKEYYKVVLSAAGKINADWKENSVHLTHGRMSFKGNKMSSRLGGVPTAAELLASVHAEVDEKNPEASEELKDQIAIAALKFTILKSQAGKNIDFDPETSLSFEGDSGPYIQYTIARSNSVLEKASEAGIKESFEKTSQDIYEVERLLYKFGEVVETAAKNWEPHHVANYGLQLARAFNSFYGNTKLVDTENPDVGYNLSLVKATSQVLKNVLHLLGIESPEKM
jgi:arginyl-tRNA synthetase